MKLSKTFKHILILLAFFLGGITTMLVWAQQSKAKNTSINHPAPQPTITPSVQKVSADGSTTYVSTGKSLFPESDPFRDPPGTNLLPNVYTNLIDWEGNEMENTLPSTPTIPYNLHACPPAVSDLPNAISPTDDLQYLFDTLYNILGKRVSRSQLPFINASFQLGIDILEGNPIPNRAYSGFPLLHYNGPEKLRKVEPVVTPGADQCDTISYNVDVHQIWYDNHIESNTNMLDVSAVQDRPWTVTYTVDILNRGEDDFSPFAFYRQKVDDAYKPIAAMDQSFFPMEDGTRTVFKIKMPPGKYYHLVYTWGWRWHPPRIQVMENAEKTFPPTPGSPSLHQIEVDIFGPNPTANDSTRKAAIAKIGDLSPAKRMWKAIQDAQTAVNQRNFQTAASLIKMARDSAFHSWKDRTHLPDEVPIDSSSDLTLFYVNNTLYGGFTDGGTIDFPKWTLRGDSLRVTLINGDFFEHAYQNVDFGGARGWENQFKSSTKVGGSGCWFTFGRAYWNKNLSQAVVLPPAEQSPYKPSRHKVHITFNFEPSRRLRFYQFDPMHHDIAIYSVH